MFTIEWTRDLEVGVAEIDDDHRVMLAMLNRMTKAHGHVDAQAVLEELGRYTLHHFEREERLMAECAYEFADKHRCEHRALYEEIRHQIDDLIARERRLTELAKFMQRWLLRHILGEDRLLALAVRRHREAQATLEPVK
ncbi:MAG TPA: bacteriohemerythrin [Aromatoleum sp.]|uniref:bacteriohemerythrin n=1 Tax=Aromatoleum sp. TaxID=2307007 RepID=UPI002B475A05|nr:bacteriohemerythrin [Aromatoleum sp.]HJV25419.1 bacteriohemerythrin [Aromatoleum sp.]